MIVIGDEVCETTLAKYSDHLHSHVFPPQCRDQVKELVGDGHEKVHTKKDCGVEQAMPMKGRRKKGTRSKGRRDRRKKSAVFDHGWFMLVDPKSKRILSVEKQIRSESNAVVLSSLRNVIHLYENCNAFVMDRNCKFKATGIADPKLKNIKYYIIDKWHAKKHCKKCKCSPENHQSLRRRLRGVNTSICEQTFSWFRGYARVFNELRPKRHSFLVLYFAALHNSMVDAGDVGHMNRYNAEGKGLTRKAIKGYHCSR